MLVVYIAGPISKGDQETNVRTAIWYADRLADAGMSPIVPHLNYYWQALYHRSYESWMALDFALIVKCDLLLRIPGESSGADREVVFARGKGIPVFFTVEDAIKYNNLRIA